MTNTELESPEEFERDLKNVAVPRLVFQLRRYADQLGANNQQIEELTAENQRLRAAGIPRAAAPLPVAQPVEQRNERDHLQEAYEALRSEHERTLGAYRALLAEADRFERELSATHATLRSTTDALASHHAALTAIQRSAAWRVLNGARKLVGRGW